VPERHGGGDADHVFVLLAQFDHGLAEDLLPHHWGPHLGRRGEAGLGVVGSETVELLGKLQGGLESLAFLGQDVDDDRFRARFGEFKGADEQRDIVAIDGAEIADAKFLEEQGTSVAAAAVGIHLRGRVFEDEGPGDALEGFLGFLSKHGDQFALGESLEPLGEILGEPIVARAGGQLAEISGDGTHVLGDAPFIVIEDPNEILVVCGRYCSWLRTRCRW
jgi:hypothetical protein